MERCPRPSDNLTTLHLFLNSQSIINYSCHLVLIIEHVVSMERKKLLLNISIVSNLKFWWFCFNGNVCDQIVKQWEGEWVQCTELLNHTHTHTKINSWSGQTSISQVSHGKSDTHHSGLFYRNGEIYNEIQQGNWKNSQIGAAKWLIGSLASSLYFFGHCVPVLWCSTADCGNRLTVRR